MILRTVLIALLASAVTVVAMLELRPEPSGERPVFTDTSQRQQVPCPDRPVHLALMGQSHAANSIGHRERSDEVVTLYEGRCYRARDPQLGGTDIHSGSLAIPLAEMTGANMVSVHGRGGSTVREWLDTYYRPETMAVPPDRIVWIQGESEHGNPDYERDLEALMTRMKGDFPDARIAILGASYCLEGPDTDVTDAQARVAARLDLQWLGNMDAFIALEHRYDGCHLGKEGRDAVLAMVEDALATAP